MSRDDDRICVVCGAPDREIVPACREGYERCRACGVVSRAAEGSRSAIIDHYETRDPVDRVSLSRIGLYSRFLREAEKRTGGAGRLLDVGCSRGDFLEQAIESGWEGYGMEPAGRLAVEASARGIRVETGVLAQIPDGWGPFDMITYWDAFMFVDDPVTEMERALAILSERGWIYMRLRQNGVQQRLHRFWRTAGRRIGLPDFSVFHPLNYTPRTIRALAARLDMEAGITSSPLTRGDPYGMHRSRIPITAGKFLVSVVSSFARGVSGGRWIVSPSMDVWMRPQGARSES